MKIITGAVGHGRIIKRRKAYCIDLKVGILTCFVVLFFIGFSMFKDDSWVGLREKFTSLSRVKGPSFEDQIWFQRIKNRNHLRRRNAETSKAKAAKRAQANNNDVTYSASLLNLIPKPKTASLGDVEKVAKRLKEEANSYLRMLTLEDTVMYRMEKRISGKCSTKYRLGFMMAISNSSLDKKMKDWYINDHLNNRAPKNGHGDKKAQLVTRGYDEVKRLYAEVKELLDSKKPKKQPRT